MFYNSGEVISDQFYHLILIQNLEEKKQRKQEVLGMFFFERGSLIPKSKCQNGDKKVKMFVKTKNAP